MTTSGGTAKSRPLLLWLTLAWAFVVLGLAGIGLAKWIERQALFFPERTRLLYPVTRVEST